MKKSFVTLTTFAVVGLGSLFVSQVTHADTIDDLKSKQSEIKDERAEIKKDLSEAEAKVADVLIDIAEINDEIDNLEAELKHNKEMIIKAEEDIVKTEEKIAEIEEEIDELEAVIEERFEVLKQRASSYQKTGGNAGYMEVLFGSTSFNDFISRVAAVTKITDSDAELIKKQEEDKAQVEVYQAEVEVELNEHKDMKIELEGMNMVIEDQQEKVKENLKSLKKKETEYKTLVADLEDEDKSLAAIESQVKQNIDDLRNPVTTLASTTSSNSSSSSSKSNDSSGGNLVMGGGGTTTAIEAGKRYIGNSTYSLGSKDPSSGRFDCSGFVSWAYEQEGRSLPRNTDGQASVGTKVSSGSMQPGDLVFFDTYKKDGHVGIYIGNGKFIGSQSSTGVAIADMNSSYWSKTFKGHVRRIN